MLWKVHVICILAAEQPLSYLFWEGQLCWSCLGCQNAITNCSMYWSPTRNWQALSHFHASIKSGERLTGLPSLRLLRCFPWAMLRFGISLLPAAGAAWRLRPFMEMNGRIPRFFLKIMNQWIISLLFFKCSMDHTPCKKDILWLDLHTVKLNCMQIHSARLLQTCIWCKLL